MLLTILANQFACKWKLDVHVPLSRWADDS